jgi:hypothetical protein
MAETVEENVKYYDYDGQPCRVVDGGLPEIMTPGGKWVRPSNDQFDTKAMPVDKKTFDQDVEEWLNPPFGPFSKVGKGAK